MFDRLLCFARSATSVRFFAEALLWLWPRVFAIVLLARVIGWTTSQATDAATYAGGVFCFFFFASRWRSFDAAHPEVLANDPEVLANRVDDRHALDAKRTVKCHLRTADAEHPSLFALYCYAESLQLLGRVDLLTDHRPRIAEFLGACYRRAGTFSWAPELPGTSVEYTAHALGILKALTGTSRAHRFGISRACAVLGSRALASILAEAHERIRAIATAESLDSEAHLAECHAAHLALWNLSHEHFALQTAQRSKLIDQLAIGTGAPGVPVASSLRSTYSAVKIMMLAGEEELLAASRQNMPAYVSGCWTADKHVGGFASRRGDRPTLEDTRLALRIHQCVGVALSVEQQERIIRFVFECESAGRFGSTKGSVPTLAATRAALDILTSLVRVPDDYANRIAHRLVSTIDTMLDDCGNIEIDNGPSGPEDVLAHIRSAFGREAGRSRRKVVTDPQLVPCGVGLAV